MNYRIGIELTKKKRLHTLTHDLNETKLFAINIHVIKINRHCDRNTVNDKDGNYGYIQSDKVDLEEKLGVERGKLTPLGIAQCVKLGEKIRKRYIDKDASHTIEGIYQNYTASQYSFVSTDLDRTLRSMWSVSQGLFPPGSNGPKVDVSIGNLFAGNFSLPFGAVSIPIHSVAGEDDLRLRAYSPSKCRKIQDNLKQYRHSKEYARVVERNQNTIEQAQQWADMKELDFDDFYRFFDLMVVQNAHHLLTSKLLLQNFNQLQEIAFESHYALFRREVLGIYGGGVFLYDIVQDFQSLINSESIPLYKHHSAHDSTLQAIIAALALDQDHAELREVPQYGAAIAFELWSDDVDHFVRIVYSNQYSNEKWTSYPWGDKCVANNFCPFANITNVGISPQDWCSACENVQAKFCLQQDYQRTNTINIVFAIAAPLLVIIIILLMMTTFILALIFIMARKGYKIKLPSRNKSSNNLLTRAQSEEYEEF